MAIIAAMERIAIQKDDFGDQLELVITEILAELKKNNKKNMNDHPAVKKLTDLIFKRTGLKLKQITNGDCPAGIISFYPNKKHIFLAEWIRDFGINIPEQNKIIKEMETKRGSVNLSTAKVTGFFSEYENPLYMDYYTLSETYSMSAGEIVAILLHEIGHGFNACYYADRTDENNQVLAAIHRRLTDHKDENNVEYVYRELKKVSDTVTLDEVDGLLNGNAVIRGKKLFDVTVGIVNTQMRDMRYSRTASEEGSDAFASRFGRGRELATALEKLHRNTDEVEGTGRTMATLVINTAYVIAITITVLGASLLATPAFLIGLFSVLLYGAISWALTKALSDAERDQTYDRLKQRYIRIRQEQIELLKNQDVPVQYAKDVIAAIRDIDAIIEKAKDFRAIPGFIGNLIFRQGKANIEMEKMLEKLASNDLYLHAAELKQHA